MVNLIWKHPVWLTEAVFTVLEIGSAGSSHSEDGCTGELKVSMPRSPQDWTEYCINLLSGRGGGGGAGCRTFSTFCNHPLCCRRLSGAQREIFQIQPEGPSRWIRPIGKFCAACSRCYWLIRELEILIIEIQLALKGCFWGNILPVLWSNRYKLNLFALIQPQHLFEFPTQLLWYPIIFIRWSIIFFYNTQQHHNNESKRKT